MFFKKKNNVVDTDRRDYIQWTYERLEEYSGGDFRDFYLWQIDNLNNKGYDGNNMVRSAIAMYVDKTEQILKTINSGSERSLIINTRNRCMDILRAIDDNLFSETRERWLELDEHCRGILLARGD